MKNFTKLAFIACFCLVSARVSAQWSLTGNDGIGVPQNFIGTLNNAPLVFRTNNVERMRINTSGNVGIGTSAPAQNLHIRSSEPGIRMEATDKLFWGRSWDIKRGVGQYANLYFIENLTGGLFDPSDLPDTCLTLTYGRRVGIGTSNPAEALDVNGRIKSTSLTTGTWPVSPSNYIFWGTNALDQTINVNYALLQGTVGPDQGRTFLNSPLDIRFRIKNNDKMVLAANGNVGIGTSNPAEALDVNGRIKSTSLTTGTWPVSPSNYIFWGTNALDQTVNTNYALLQGTVGPDQGRTFLNSPLDIRFRIKNTDRMVLDNNGNVGIGTSNPAEALDVNGRIKSTSLTTGTWPVSPSNYIFWGTNALDQTINVNYALLQGTVGPDQGRTFLNSPLDIRFRIKNNDKMVLAANGNVGIGTTNPQSKLAVKGKITAQEVEVTMLGWADFVFKPDYKLLPLSEVEKFIKDHRHLPGVPSETEVLSKNQNLGEMNALLMQKIEELTLYVIELEKKVNQLTNN